MSFADLSAQSQDSITLRPAIPADVPTLVALIQALAEYEKLSHEVTGRPEDLARHLFGERPYAEAVLAELDGTTVGMALYFFNFSTFLMQPGLYLEDLFVLPDYRRRGVGQALFKYLGQLALERGCGRFEWSVLDWNTPAIEFYQRMGAEIKPEWQLCRLTGEALQAFGQG
ncbi:GNAT family N-acetyltransferase [Phormidium sp. FACHB-1136]|uniref:GNAT family N-acetyltransferase n=1 Tax=Phormidium sp. FACHB-1136 TaxID=2692848 RepID=UPI00168995D6|nr:GNAT family N-acetyltransferase [Phormidium sp. FACHB-1136]MBD2429455.1 GNAT family N-acetyltransferase [Phormidium sp. FACHB-1136]